MHHQAMTRRPPYALIALLIAAALALTGCASSGSPGADVTPAPGSPVTAPGAVPDPAADPAPDPAPSPASPMSTWCAGQGYTDDEEAVTDADQVIQDVQGGNYASYSADGTALEEAAFTAGSQLPPASDTRKLRYGLYFGWLAIFGKDVAADDMAGWDNAAAEVVKFRPAVLAVDETCTADGD